MNRNVPLPVRGVLLMGAGIVKLHDLAGSAAGTLRKRGLEQPARRDAAVRE